MRPLKLTHYLKVSEVASTVRAVDEDRAVLEREDPRRKRLLRHGVAEPLIAMVEANLEADGDRFATELLAMTPDQVRVLNRAVRLTR